MAAPDGKPLPRGVQRHPSDASGTGEGKNKEVRGNALKLTYKHL